MRHIVMRLVRHIFSLTGEINPIPTPSNFFIYDNGDFMVSDTYANFITDY
jgi:hypothetical protein